MAVSKEEFLWREWVLGEGRFAGKGARSDPRPPSIREKIPKTWWQRLDEVLVKRGDKKEKATPKRPKTAPKEARPRAKPGQLTPHFTISEFNCHNGQRVPAYAVPALKKLCEKYLEPMRAKFGPAKVMSGYRPTAYNAKIGGARYSQHIYDLTPDSVAADLIFSKGTPRQWAAEAKRLRAGGVGTYPSFVHVDNRTTIARWP